MTLTEQVVSEILDRYEQEVLLPLLEEHCMDLKELFDRLDAEITDVDLKARLADIWAKVRDRSTDKSADVDPQTP